MSVSIFDRYSIRAYLCATIFLFSPFLLDCYLLIPEFRSLSVTVLVGSVILSIGCLTNIWLRFRGNKLEKRNYLAEYLKPTSTAVKPEVKQRYYQVLSKKSSDFEAFLRIQDLPDAEVSALCESAAYWLRSNTRGDQHALVLEENMNYGLIRNLKSVKIPFLTIFTIYTALIIWIAYRVHISLLETSVIGCIGVHILTYLFWCFGITNSILKFVSDRYAKAVLSEIDSM